MGKDQDEVRTIIAGPAVWICDECVDLCDSILEERLNQDARAPQPASVTARDRWVSTGPVPTCPMCGILKDPDELVHIPDRGPICTVCLDVIRAVIEDQNEK